MSCFTYDQELLIEIRNKLSIIIHILSGIFGLIFGTIIADVIIG